MTKSRGILKRRVWTEIEIEQLRALYPDHKTSLIVNAIGRPIWQLYHKAQLLGLKKSAAFMASSESGRLTKLTAGGVRHRFPKGHVPANKGLRRPGWFSGRMRETQFQKGGFPINRDPDYYVIGALRVNTDGYIDMRVSFAPGANGWRALHSILWEDAHGKIPRTHCLRFKDGDRLNVELGNLELLTRSDNMRRNSIHRILPKDLVQTKQLLGQLKRRVREEQNRRLA